MAGRRWAVVHDGVVENVILWDGERPWAPPEGRTVIDLRDDATVGIRDIYSPETGTFARPAPIASTRVLTVHAFKLLLTADERIAIRASGDPRVVDWLDLLNSASEVDLGSEGTIEGVRYLEAVGLLGEGRADEILSP